MSTDFVPQRESELVTYTNNFGSKLSTLFASVGCTSAQSTNFATLNSNWTSSYAIATAPATRTRDTIITKNNNKKLCVANLRALAKIMQGYPGTTDALRAQFGITIPKPLAPIPAPTEIPLIEIRKRYGTTVFIRLQNEEGKNKKPPGVVGARVYSHVGTTFPPDPADWFLEGQATRHDVEVQFNAELPAGTTVWFTAAWYSQRGQLGPGCSPVSTVLAGGALQLAA